ncbi:MAG: uncharacterized protein A8A55_1927 [Amphiamblys sp. WSBS2006]|nr:MAG: uncharacterized protein A8A55_1927 [Amphiamblys sp. WSBS2006]
MFNLAYESFAKHGDSFFLEEKRGVLIVSKALLENEREEIQKKRQFLYEQRQKVLEAAKQNVLNDINPQDFERHKELEATKEELSPLITQLQTPDSFSLTQDFPNEAILLTEKTTVTLSNIEISVKLFLVLLGKARVTVGERFSITKHARNEDCIGEHDMTRTPFGLARYEAVSSLALENIEGIPKNSIGCYLKEVSLYNTGLINILPKLRIHEDSEVECFWVTADEKEHVSTLLEQEKMFCVGRVKIVNLSEYAVSVITKMRIHEDSVVESLTLVASRKKHVAAVLEQDKTFFVRRVKRVKLYNYAVRVITKMRIHEDNTMEDFVLAADKKHFPRTLEEGDSSIELGRIRRSGFYVPREIRRKLRYTLVDGEGKEERFFRRILCIE